MQRAMILDSVLVSKDLREFHPNRVVYGQKCSPWLTDMFVCFPLHQQVRVTERVFYALQADHIVDLSAVESGLGELTTSRTGVRLGRWPS